MIYVITSYIVINSFGFFLMLIDKRKAEKGKWRISEKRLWIVAFLGGGLGQTIGMNRFRHKTKHLQFKIGLPVITAINLVIYIYMLYLLS